MSTQLDSIEQEHTSDAPELRTRAPDVPLTQDDSRHALVPTSFGISRA